MDKQHQKYLKLLKESYPTRQSVCREIINLSAITNLPKGTEHFMSDLHGEYEAFLHIINNCSGVVKEKVDLLFYDTMSSYDRQELCTLIYYPKEKLNNYKHDNILTENWYRTTLTNLVQIAKLLSSKYTRSKVRKALPEEYAYIIDELLHVQEDEDSNQVRYHEEILRSIIAINNADDFIIALSDLIKRLAVDHLHIVGDIYDRGGSADRIMSLLMDHHSIDIEWGNHDILWMGAACGNDACIATVLANNLKYGNTEILEHAYGISLRPLIVFAMDKYDISDPVQAAFRAIKLILFKIEGQLIKKHPEYNMDYKLLLDKIEPSSSIIDYEGTSLPIDIKRFPTVDWSNPYELTVEEKEIIDKLHSDFTTSKSLHKHIEFLYDKGGMYRIFNDNLLYHGCVPLDDKGNFDYVEIFGEKYHGKALLDKTEEIARKAFSTDASEECIDFMWYLWIGEKSPLCGRKTRIFEREYLSEESTWIEPSNPYYKFYYEEPICEQILHEFGLYSNDAHIINGHTPVLTGEGEKPIRANKRLFVIDGGFCRPMNKTTGIAGYTLIFNSHGLRLKAHSPFTSVEDAIKNNADIESESELVPIEKERILVKDTDTGKEILSNIKDLEELLQNYSSL